MIVLAGCLCREPVLFDKRRERIVMLLNMKKLLARLAEDERGLTSVEYAVLGGIVVTALVSIGAAFQTNLTEAFNNLFNLI